MQKRKKGIFVKFSASRHQRYDIYCSSKKTCSFVNRKIGLPENTLQGIIDRQYFGKQLWNIPFEAPPRHQKVFHTVQYVNADLSIRIILKFFLDMLFQVPHRHLIVMQNNVSTGRSLKLAMSSIRGLPLSEYIRLPFLIRLMNQFKHFCQLLWHLSRRENLISTIDFTRPDIPMFCSNVL